VCLFKASCLETFILCVLVGGKQIRTMATSGSSIERAAQRLAPGIIGMMKEAVDDKSKRSLLLTTADQIEKLALDNDLAYHDHLKPWQSACHPDNRYGVGLEPVDCHELMWTMAQKGFSFKLSTGGRAMDKLTKDPAKAAHQELWNQQLVNSSEGLLPEVPVENMTRMTVAGCHTAAVMRIAHYGAAGIKEELQDASGRVTKETIIKFQPTFREPSEKGIRVVVFRQELELVVPGLAGFISEAGHVGHGSERMQSTAQTLFQVHARIMLQRQRTGPSGPAADCFVHRDHSPVAAGRGARHVRLCACIWRWG
jgi:hypothetical protein